MDGDDEAVHAFIESYLAASRDNMDANLERLTQALGTIDAEEVSKLEERFAGIRAVAGPPRRGCSARAPATRVQSAPLSCSSSHIEPCLYVASLLLDVIVEVEEHQDGRHRHVRMVERCWPAGVGTGGSGGVDYLDKTLNYRVFRDLWVAAYRPASTSAAARAQASRNLRICATPT